MDRKNIGSLFLMILCLVLVFVRPLAAENRGSEIRIIKNDKQKISGELIAVKKDAGNIMSTRLLLKEEQSGADVSVALSEIDTAYLKRKSKMLLSLGLGAAIGGFMAFVIPWENKKYVHGENLGKVASTLFLAGGVLAGTMVGLYTGIDKKYQVKGMSISGVEIFIQEMGSKARIRDWK